MSTWRQINRWGNTIHVLERREGQALRRNVKQQDWSSNSEIEVGGVDVTWKYIRRTADLFLFKGAVSVLT